MGPSWGPPGSIRPQIGPVLAPWTHELSILTCYIWDISMHALFLCRICMNIHLRCIENPSWAPVWNGVHPSEFVFQKSRAIASDFCGIQTQCQWNFNQNIKISFSKMYLKISSAILSRGRWVNILIHRELYEIFAVRKLFFLSEYMCILCISIYLIDYIECIIQWVFLPFAFSYKICTEALKGHRVVWKSKFTISSGWLKNGSLCHPDDIITLS